ncbi:heavy metal translocating P-type ATPase [candidate division KSB3 bacterium]|uniref:Heavy metal translocating P-type ATPase n=1 Tax=candidate division KSB3 bacterium TaxID=2044937 RepID=A0A2G6E692_9BACT|nr:MAG: heavy metal translocating P-type ATPase [candidate division KSB3 bacterium]PIE29975.1 MAG: heavy metal translocating P-type ATPase [candidate division KSB3 bacterium]
MNYACTQRYFTIKHWIPNRIRFKVYPIRFDQEAASDLASTFKATPGVTAAEAHPRSASLIVYYNETIITKEDLTAVLSALYPPAQRVSPANTPQKPALEAAAPTLQRPLLHFLSLSALMTGVFIREVLLKQVVTQTLLSPLGLISIVTAWPLVKKGLRQMQQGEIKLESFLGGSLIAATAAGEAITALEILWITSGASLLQAWVTERSRRAIRDILEVTGHNTFLFLDGIEVEVPVDQVRPGDIVVFHTGEKLSIDGKIERGEAMLDESPINGRAERILRSAGDKVFAGTLVDHGVIFVQAEQVGDRTYLARVLRMVEESLERKAPIEGVADRLAKQLITLGSWTTLATWLISGSAWRAFSVMLVMACPCATILAASSAVSAAINAAARRGILFKGGRYLEELGKANIVCFDKTGTLTTTEPEIQKIICVNDLPERELLQLAYSVEKHNFHPLAEAIKAEAESREIAFIQHEVCEYVIGKGVRAEIHQQEILAGSHKLMQQFAIDTTQAQETLRELRQKHLTTVFIARDKTVLGMIGFANRERPHAQPMIDYLHQHGIEETLMVTGDENDTAEELAGRLGMTMHYSSVMPEEKARIVSHLKGKGRTVLMVGDGINDALALAEADIGMAMGAGGSEVAIEAADIALVNDDLPSVIYAHALSQQTLNVVRQNFRIATGSNLIGAILGASGLLAPVAAGLLHIVHTLGVLANSSRLLSFQTPEVKKIQEPSDA